jgi:flagella basal body P-ring formation protein FlgA
MDKKVKKTALIIVIIMTTLFINRESASGYIINSQFISEKVKEDLYLKLKPQISGRIELSVEDIPYDLIEIPNGKLKIETEPNFRYFNQNSIVRVNIYVNNIRVKSFGLRIKIQVFDKVWVAKDVINIGESLYSVKLEEKELTSRIADPAKESFNPQNYMAKKIFRPGEIITLGYVEEAPTIMRDSPVSVIFKTSLVSVTVPCTALTSGKTGDYIKVRNKAYRRDYLGKIIGTNLVLVNI